MFFKNKKISSNLIPFLKSGCYDSYRVLIEFKKFHKDSEKIIKSLRGEVLLSFTHLKLVCATLPTRGIYRLCEYPEVLSVSLDDYCFLCELSESNSSVVNNRNIDNFTGRDVVSAIIDSGAFPHPDLLSPSRIVKFTDLVNGLRYPYDDNGHGTAISTLICGSGSKSKFRYKGVAEKSSLAIYKVFDRTGKAFLSNILHSLELILDDIEETNIKLLYMPFESFNTPLKHIEYFDILLEKITALGVIPIMPSGSNKNSKDSMSGLALAKNLIIVGGLKSDLSPYEYSSGCSNNKKINICYKCTDMVCGNTIRSYISERDSMKIFPPKLKNFYKTYTGTSISGAYICGICALLLEKYPDYNFKDVSSRLELCSKKINDIPYNLVGNGSLDIESFLK